VIETIVWHGTKLFERSFCPEHTTFNDLVMVIATRFLLNSSAVVTGCAIRRIKGNRKVVRVGTRKGKPTRRRKRRRVNDIFHELGRKVFRRAYRMHIESFFELYQTLKQDLYRVMNYDGGVRKHAPNGRIHPTVRLACALRFFAGGDVLDIVPTYGISKTEVHESILYVIQATNVSETLVIKFPTNHDEQRAIAEGFRRKSGAGFSCCAGAEDGMLVWCLKPTEFECNQASVGSKKFFCGRKHKFGLNLQACCDHNLKFTNVSIKYPAATSDLLAFENSPFRHTLEQDGFLADGLCIFGDNAYVNRSYMATPFPNVGEETTKDHYNFYHSQLRIHIECAFGVLVQRWGVLRKPTPQNFTIKKINALVLCCCKLHNFLVDQRSESNPPTVNTPEDRLNLELNGAVPMNGVAGTGNTAIPDQLLNGGEHFDDDPSRSIRRRHVPSQNVLPRDSMHALVITNDYRRPPRRE